MTGTRGAAAINRWLRAMNPFMAPRGMAEAQRSARALAIGLALSTVVGFGAMAWIMTSGWLEAAMSAQYAQTGLSADDLAMQEAIMDAIGPFMMAFGAVFATVLSGGLGWAQWRYMTRAIPIILLALTVYGVVSNAMAGLVVTIPAPAMPLWVLAVSWGTMLVCALIYAASLRGAIVLHKLRSEP